MVGGSHQPPFRQGDLFHDRQPKAAAAAAAAGPGQTLADDLGYVPLRGDILKKAKAAVARIGA